ncbi:SPOR domain-containing protein [Massilia sp. KIM]|uniref:SPOR domain-containing protein n=1 Tax=Massilia sp. KIM TaxID=1955422 RepID=UPI00098EA2FA|nr:SPOR domain-containing protein [Massilia sp. KIM]OON64474.1 SPOR domain-containing protein [Massilia sp. KIM]
MLKFVFWALLALNALLFAHGRGLLGTPAGGEREPARLKNQLALDRITLLSDAEATVAASAGTADPAAPAEQAALPPAGAPAPAAPLPVAAVAAAPAPTAPAPAAPLLACVQAGPFSAGDARRFENRAARLDLGQRQTRLSVPFQEVSSYMVYLPPAGGKEGADKRVAELKERGIDNYFVMQGESPMRYAISLGVFKTEAAAETELANLGRQGVRGVRILPRGPQGTRTAFQFRDIDAATRARIADIARDFPAPQLQTCR